MSQQTGVTPEHAGALPGLPGSDRRTAGESNRPHVGDAAVTAALADRLERAGIAGTLADASLVTFPCVAHRFKACASLMSAGCCWWWSLAVGGGSGSISGGTLAMRTPGRLMTCGRLHDVPWHELW